MASKMSHFLVNNFQHTTKEANENRLVTKLRWVVEAVNGVIKRWRYFAKIVSNINIHHIIYYKFVLNHVLQVEKFTVTTV